MAEAELIFAAQNVVGESAVWDDRQQRLRWVDIIGRTLYSLDPVTKSVTSTLVPGRPTAVGLRIDGGLIMGLERELVLADGNGFFERVCEVEPKLPANRLNEGVVGPDGAFWVGTMQNNIAPDNSPLDITANTGRIYRYSSAGELTCVCDDQFGITNTFVWPTPQQLITADTTCNTMYAYTVEPVTGRLSERKEILKDYARGLPDGSCLDAEGNVWTARVVGGACLTCMDAQGSVLRTVELPCSWPTSCCFGGADFDTLFVTSARFTMEPEHLEQHPQEGGVFAVQVGVAGCPAYRFG